MNTLNIIGDADALIAILNPADAHNSRAEATVRELTGKKASLYFPTSTIAETITTFQRRETNPQLAEQVINACKSGRLVLLPVTEEIIALALTIFDPHGSKQDTFFDAIVAATAKHYKADAVFSFDGWYRKVGLTLAGDLFDVKPEAA